MQLNWQIQYTADMTAEEFYVEMESFEHQDLAIRGNQMRHTQVVLAQQPQLGPATWSLKPTENYMIRNELMTLLPLQLLREVMQLMSEKLIILCLSSGLTAPVSYKRDAYTSEDWL